MVTLAIETVTPEGSLALLAGDRLVSISERAAEPHGVRLPSALVDLLSREGLSLDDVDALAVVVGPGSFTGVRIGMACAQGLATTRGWRVVPIGTLDAIAEGWRATNATTAPSSVVACLDGMRGEVFSAVYRWTGYNIMRESEPSVHVPSTAWFAAIREPRIIVGSGAIRYASMFGEAAVDFCEPLAASAVRIAARGEVPAVVPHALRPTYVRRPDVELARERR